MIKSLNSNEQPYSIIHKDTILDSMCILISNSYDLLVMATRQNSTNGKPKSPRIQVVLTESLCEQLADLAEEESRTVSNMAKVLIQQGINNYIGKTTDLVKSNLNADTDTFRDKLEKQSIKRLKGPPKRIRYFKTLDN